MEIWITVTVLLALLAIAVIAALSSAKRKYEAEKNNAAALAAENNSLRERYSEFVQKTEESQRASGERALELAAENSALRARLELAGKQAEKDKEELGRLQDSFRLEFRNLANDILDEKAKQFKDASQQSIDTLLKPFNNSINAFRERVEAIYADENRQRGALQNEIRNLHDLNRRITEETTNLTNALKGNSKVQGDWGEMILQTLLEHSNLIPGIHFTTQQNLKDTDGNNLRPDVILNLPDKKQVVIDSKVSLTAYAGYCSDCEAQQRERFMKDHIGSVRKHVDELGRKSYQEYLESPDFVIMFIPNEPAYLAAMQGDPSIWNDAYNKKVIISSPTNLLALLKIVHELWRRDDQSRNALEIADEGANLYDKLVGLTETLESLGKNIISTEANYEKAMKQLSTGSGNLIKRAEKMKVLGLKTRKQLNKGLLEAAGAEEEGLEEQEE